MKIPASYKSHDHHMIHLKAWLLHELTSSVTIICKHTYIISVNLDDHGGYPNILLTGPQTTAN